jgi:hypothetical protein
MSCRNSFRNLARFYTFVSILAAVWPAAAAERTAPIVATPVDLINAFGDAFERASNPIFSRHGSHPALGGDKGLHSGDLALNVLKPVGDDELSQSRGGFFTVDGIEFDFGANVQTLVNGQLALQTNVQWTPAGASVQQVSGNITNSISIPASQLTALFGSTGGVVSANGVQITSPSGSIEVAANVTGGQVQNLVVNSASNQAITQNTAVTLAVYNFAAWQQALTLHAVSGQLASDVLAASRFGH